MVIQITKLDSSPAASRTRMSPILLGLQLKKCKSPEKYSVCSSPLYANNDLECRDICNICICMIMQDQL
ncbi:Hypothetical predicted protein [Octopus vulgaris]|uniref:Uncharacterized protein n=1 Tax=Octopus vulgaris TaxID=6645 RepID=A0AA36BKU8_OCTVU|nr:Hypothetical predicted protein [Octopus vulgaris]